MRRTGMWEMGKGRGGHVPEGKWRSSLWHCRREYYKCTGPGERRRPGGGGGGHVAGAVGEQGSELARTYLSRPQHAVPPRARPPTLPLAPRFVALLLHTGWPCSSNPKSELAAAPTDTPSLPPTSPLPLLPHRVNNELVRTICQQATSHSVTLAPPTPPPAPPSWHVLSCTG